MGLFVRSAVCNLTLPSAKVAGGTLFHIWSFAAWASWLMGILLVCLSHIVHSSSKEKVLFKSVCTTPSPIRKNRFHVKEFKGRIITQGIGYQGLGRAESHMGNHTQPRAQQQRTTLLPCLDLRPPKLEPWRWGRCWRYIQSREKRGKILGLLASSQPAISGQLLPLAETNHTRGGACSSWGKTFPIQAEHRKMRNTLEGKRQMTGPENLHNAFSLEFSPALKKWWVQAFSG